MNICQDNSNTKICSKCNQLKEFSQFYIRKNGRIETQCKQCIRNRTNQYRLKNYASIQIKKKIFFIKNKSKIYKTNKLYRQKEINKLKRKVYEKIRRNNDICYKLLTNERTQLTKILNGRKKSEHTTELLGCSIIQFKQHLESQWLSGMNWNNYGNNKNRWSIDHILCLELFNFSDKKQRKFAFNYKNTKPIWHQDNIKKQDFLLDGRRARDLTPTEKQEYLTKHGFGYLFN